MKRLSSIFFQLVFDQIILSRDCVARRSVPNERFIHMELSVGVVIDDDDDDV